MATKTYSEKLKDPRWQKKRLEVLSRDNFKCTSCGNDKITLHVHHSKYTNEPWDAPLKHLKTVCENCHAKEHSDKIYIEPNYWTEPPSSKSNAVNSFKLSIDYIEEKDLLERPIEEIQKTQSIAAIIQWQARYCESESNKTIDEFNKTVKPFVRDVTRQSWVKSLKELMHDTCIEWNVVITKNNTPIYGKGSAYGDSKLSGNEW